MTAFSCCLNVSFGKAADAPAAAADPLVFFLEGVRLLARVGGPPLLARSRGDLRSWARSRGCCWFFFGVRGAREATGGSAAAGASGRVLIDN